MTFRKICLAISHWSFDQCLYKNSSGTKIKTSELRVNENVSFEITCWSYKDDFELKLNGDTFTDYDTKDTVTNNETEDPANEILDNDKEDLANIRDDSAVEHWKELTLQVNSSAWIIQYAFYKIVIIEFYIFILMIVVELCPLLL